jgi:hypothetical protein
VINKIFDCRGAVSYMYICLSRDCASLVSKTKISIDRNTSLSSPENRRNMGQLTSETNIRLRIQRSKKLAVTQNAHC